MKFHQIGIIIGITGIFLTGCASGGQLGDSSSGSSQASKVEVDNPSLSLAEYLKRVPGVNVVGSSGNVRITVRGALSVHGNTSPLFVVDGIRYGRIYSRVQSLVSVNDVASIRVLKGVEASSVYGMEGSAGVIEITTKK